MSDPIRFTARLSAALLLPLLGFTASAVQAQTEFDPVAWQTEARVIRATVAAVDSIYQGPSLLHVVTPRLPESPAARRALRSDLHAPARSAVSSSVASAVDCVVTTCTWARVQPMVDTMVAPETGLLIHIDLVWDRDSNLLAGVSVTRYDAVESRSPIAWESLLLTFSDRNGQLVLIGVERNTKQ